MSKVLLSENAQQVANSRYFLENEDWEKCCARVADTIASVEHNNKEKVKEEFFEVIYNMDFIPAGRILRNCGRPKGSLFNCYHIGIGDSIEEIGQCLKDCLVLWAGGGGVGVNFTPLRPKGDVILGKGGNSSGLVSFLEAFDSVANTIESGGSRRAAAIAHVDVAHPEILDFIDSKLIHGKLNHFNISVMINNEFLEAVEKNDDWQFKFKQKTYGKQKAKDIWNKIILNMLNCAEPGLINTSNFFKNNSYYFSPVTGCNPCGEAILSPSEACDLGSIVLPNYITGNVNTNWKKLDTVIKTAVRFLDNVIDVNKYDLKDIDIKVHDIRRIGIGIIGLAEYLFAKKLRYGSEKAVIETERLMRFIRDSAYQASIELSIEKGSFPKFEPIQYGKASFVRKLPAQLRMDIKKHGIRNCTLLSFAPTGTISLLCEKTGGVEPLFAKALLRKDRVSERMYIHPKYQEILKSEESTPEWFVDSFDLTPKDHFEMQVACQKYCDAAVSKTVNLPKETTKEQLSDLLLEYIKDLKGVTVYRDGSREGQILNRVSEEYTREYLKSQNEISASPQEETVQCASGSCEL
jgi:ribonucleoside-diphosphate reductase alpha chain